MQRLSKPFLPLTRMFSCFTVQTGCSRVSLALACTHSHIRCSRTFCTCTTCCQTRKQTCTNGQKGKHYARRACKHAYGMCGWVRARAERSWAVGKVVHQAHHKKPIELKGNCTKCSEVCVFFFVFDSNHPLHPEDDNKRCKCLLGLSIFGATGVIPTWESGWLRRGGVGGRISSLFDDMVTPPPFPILSQFNHLEHLEFGVSQCPGLLASLYTQQA